MHPEGLKISKSTLKLSKSDFDTPKYDENNFSHHINRIPE